MPSAGLKLFHAHICPVFFYRREHLVAGDVNHVAVYSKTAQNPRNRCNAPPENAVFSVDALELDGSGLYGIGPGIEANHVIIDVHAKIPFFYGGLKRKHRFPCLRRVIGMIIECDAVCRFGSNDKCGISLALHQ